MIVLGSGALRITCIRSSNQLLVVRALKKLTWACAGWAAGWAAGLAAGFAACLAAGFAAGLAAGFAAGLAAGWSPGEYGPGLALFRPLSSFLLAHRQ